MFKTYSRFGSIALLLASFALTQTSHAQVPDANPQSQKPATAPNAAPPTQNQVPDANPQPSPQQPSTTPPATPPSATPPAREPSQAPETQAPVTQAPPVPVSRPRVAEGAPPATIVPGPFIRNLAFDQKNIWTSPFKTTVRDLNWIVPLVGLEAGLINADAELESRINPNSSLSKHGSTISNA